MNSFHLLQKDQKTAVCWRGDAVAGFLIFLEREKENTFSLRFWPIGPSVLDGARSKVALRGEGYAWAQIWWSSDNSKCHTPNPGPTRLADPNRVRDARLDTVTLYLIFFFLNRTGTCGYGPHLITESKSHIHLQSPIYIYKTELLHLQIRARNLHVVNPYKCVGPTVCECLMTSSPVPIRIKNPC